MLNPDCLLPSLETEIDVSPDGPFLASHEEEGACPPVVHQMVQRLRVGDMGPAGQADRTQSEGERISILLLPKLPGMSRTVRVVNGHAGLDVSPVES